MRKLIIILSFLPLLASATNYTWNNTNGNINITNATFGTLHGGDTVFIPVKSGGYRSFSFSGIGTVSEGSYIVIYWQAGSFVTPNTSSPRNANIMDNSNWVKVQGWVDNDQIDVAWFQYQNTGYSHHIYFQDCVFMGMNGFFGSFDQSGTLPNYTGGNDTTNCFYYWTWDNCRFDSLVGGNSGNTALWIGAIAKNQTWVHAEIKNCYFGHYSSASAPACYIAAANVWGLYIHHNQFEQLGKNGPVWVGHAAQIFLRAWYGEIHHNKHFGANLGNCIRNYGGCGHVYGMTLPTTMGWSVNYDGRSRVYDNIDSGSLKYPYMETDYNTANATTLGYYQPRTGPEVWFITGKSLFLDATGDAYVPSISDCYENDTVFVKGSLLTGPIDTNWTACGIGTHGLGCNLFINAGNGPITKWDTAYNSFSQYAYTTGIDSITLKPFSGGFVTRRVTSYPSYITTDFYDRPRSAITAAGAIEYFVTNQRIHYPFHKNISRKL